MKYLIFMIWPFFFDRLYNAMLAGSGNGKWEMETWDWDGLSRVFDETRRRGRSPFLPSPITTLVLLGLREKVFLLFMMTMMNTILLFYSFFFLLF